MQSLTTASEILTQLRQLTDTLAATCQDIDMLKHEQHNASDDGNDSGELEEMADESATPSHLLTTVPH